MDRALIEGAEAAQAGKHLDASPPHPSPHGPIFGFHDGRAIALFLHLSGDAEDAAHEILSVFSGFFC